MGQLHQDEFDQTKASRSRMPYREGLKTDHTVLERDPEAMAEFQNEVDLCDTAGNDGLAKL